MFLHLILGREDSLKYGTYLEVFVKLEFECNELLNTHMSLSPEVYLRNKQQHRSDHQGK